MRPLAALFLITIGSILAFLGCEALTGESCTVGDEEGCACATGASGMRQCGASGRWGACECPPARLPDAGPVDRGLSSQDATTRGSDLGGPDIVAPAGPLDEAAWVSLPGGVFVMGRDDGQEYEGPAHQVTVQHFEMLRVEVTVGQYAACVVAGACQAPDQTFTCDPATYPAVTWRPTGRDDAAPVNCVDALKAEAFCLWTGGRLPSEAQWEYAARSSGAQDLYPWGAAPASCALAVMDDSPASDAPGCGAGGPSPSCSRPPGETAQGLCDMAGNLSEWTDDCYQTTYAGAPVDGSARPGAMDCDRSVRGGDWDSPPAEVTVTYREWVWPGAASAYLGFRCVR